LNETSGQAINIGSLSTYPSTNLTNNVNVQQGQPTLPRLGSSYGYLGNGSSIATLTNLPTGSLSQLADVFTLEMWVYPTTTSYNQALYAAWTTQLSTGWRVVLYDNSVYMEDQNGQLLFDGAAHYNTTLPADEWSHIAFVKVAGSITLYINGASIGTENHNVSRAYPPTQIYVGTDYHGSAYTGRVDEIAYYEEVAFTPQRIMQHYLNGSASA
jgi:arabinan endo-1,5-alpha-L-arabinosidase